MKNIAQRYLVAQFIVPFVIGLVFFSLFLLVFQLFKFLPLAIKGDLSTYQLFVVMGNIMLSFLLGAIPLSGLFSAIYTMNLVSDSSELVVMRSFGMDVREIMKPFIIIAAAIGITTYFLTSQIIPSANGQYNNMMGKLKTNGMSIKIIPKVFYTEIPNVFIFAEEVNKKGDKLKKVFIQSKLSGKEKVIYAEVGVLLKQDFGKNRLPGIRLHLVNGNLFSIGDNSETIEKISFEHYNFPVFKGGGAPVQKQKFRMMKSSLLSKLLIKYKFEYLNKKNTNVLKKISYKIKNIKLELLDRILTSFQVFIFILVGFTIGINNSRKVSNRSGLIGVLFMFLYYIIYFSSISYFNKGIINSYFVIGLPISFSILFFLYRYKKLEWN